MEVEFLTKRADFDERGWFFEPPEPVSKQEQMQRLMDLQLKWTALYELKRSSGFAYLSLDELRELLNDLQIPLCFRFQRQAVAHSSFGNMYRVAEDGLEIDFGPFIAKWSKDAIRYIRLRPHHDLMRAESLTVHFLKIGIGREEIEPFAIEVMIWMT